MKTSCKRLLCLVLCLLMIVSCVPIAGAEGDTASQMVTDGSLAEKANSTRNDTNSHSIEDNTINYEKQVKLDNDGTYTFQLESYVTGAVTPQPVPLDIVLVLDQSASMVYNTIPSVSDLPNSIRYRTLAKDYRYDYLMELPLLLYAPGDGYVYQAKVTKSTAGSLTGERIAILGGKEYTVNTYSQTVTTASSYRIPLSDWCHYAPNQENYKMAQNSSGKYYYYNTSNTSETTQTFDTVQEAFDYMRSTYHKQYYSDYQVVSPLLSSGYYHTDVSYCLPVYFRVSGTKYTISYYTSSGWQTGEVDACDPWLSTLPSTDSNYAYCKSEKLFYMTREDVLQTAVYDFIDGVSNISKDQDVDHRIAMVGFGSGKDYTYADGSNEGEGAPFLGTELLSTTNAVNYADATTTDYQNALQSVRNGDGTQNSQLLSAVDNIEGNGNTFLNYGLEMAQKILDARTKKTYSVGNREMPRKTVVIVFTDGVPGDAGNYGEFVDLSECSTVKSANRAIAEAKKLKDAGASVYCIGMVEGADPAASYNFTQANRTLLGGSYPCYVEEIDAINAFLHFLSSDYPNATSMTSENRTTVINNGYVYAANNSDTLDEAFTNISENVAVSTVELTTAAVVRDVMAEGFDLPIDIESDPKKYVQVFTSDYLGTDPLGDDQWGELVPTDKCFITANRATKTVDVTGFDYQKHYVHKAYSDSNGQTVPAGGKRLVITISGVTANDEAIQNALVNTNDPSSGIYTDSGVAAKLVAPFEVPTEYLQKKVFTLDYFMPTEIPCVDVGVFTPLHLSATGMTEFSEYTTSVECANGRVTLENGILYCIPTNSDFHETNHFYLYGLDANGENVWSKISFLPANNVFYEDDWATYSDNWSVDGVANGNTETLSNPVHGYIASKVNEQGYSNGSAHYSATPGSYAEFTFSGTGIDVYCRTDEACGVSLALLTPEGEELATKYFMVDNESTSDTYYQTPTVFFHGLPYGTYSLKIIVVENESRNHYYLDGFRVYNPLRVDDEITKLAYGAEYHSDYTTIRNLLINPTNSTTANITGAFFIDEVTDEKGNGSSTNSNAIETYVDLGPKNEVYLSSGNSIVLKVDPNAYYYVGIKAPAGSATVSYSYGTTAEGEDARKEVTINSAADLYYEVIPSAEGYIEIKNLSGGIISLTKLRICGNEKGLALRSASAAEILDYANRFDSLREATEHTFTAPTYTKAPKQAKLLFRKIKKPIIGRETQ